ncbi:transcription factor S [Methanimicrococcus blatticola]|uniref:Transcription factor S n=1 Tax=Methanimicrococcus blatticola TaxID=91560 RepID=A0A484F267_9EURY|nr:transcription factor S [Methanimicrococcus blatticola]MBZ3936367.1 transcription factor S [Methanimicrococcus blatticola]MCC2509529.1 transcription factor S [Methanimicrococcus blatticola]TDQ67583.1 DNA-directed RNA polymerase subunit M [Methanimicrococcus blatticola]
MQFCPKCKSMMMPAGSEFKCKKCGCTSAMGDSSELAFKSEIQEREVVVLEGDIEEGLPTTDVMCPECKNRKAYWWLRQLRSADESETRFFKCTKCAYTWREYD